MNCDSSYLAYFDFSVNNSVLVTGPGSTWQNRQQVVLGNSGWRNRAVISAGGQATSGHISVGSQFSSDNSIVITDPGSLWQSTGDLNVGSAGHINRATITNGARLHE